MSGSIFRAFDTKSHDVVVHSARSRPSPHTRFSVSPALAAENLFLLEQLALFQERTVKSHQAADSTRLIMVILGRLFACRDALVNVKPDPFLRRHRKGFRLLWRWKSRPSGRCSSSKVRTLLFRFVRL